MKAGFRIGLIGAYLILAGCGRTTSLDNNAAFKPLLGKTYATKMNFAVVRYRGNDKKRVLVLPGGAAAPSLKSMPKTFPFEFNDDTILGILPKGRHLQITHIERYNTMEDSFVEVYAKVLGEGNFKDSVIEVGILTDQRPPVPIFLPKYAEAESLP